MAEVEQEVQISLEPPHIKEEPESPDLKEGPEEFPFHLITVKNEEESEANDSETDRLEDFDQEHSPKILKSYAPTPPDSCGAELRPFSCVVCRRGFKCRSDLQRHESSVHSGERPHHCLLCGKSFSLKFNLISHLKTHSGDKPFVCTICERGFVRKSRLSEHQRSIHHICPVCSGSFSDKDSLNQHLKAHVEEGTLDSSSLLRETVKPFLCSECGDSFKKKADLQRHVSSVHRGERPHKCLVCEKRFALKCNLKDHMNTHTGEKPFVCLFCGKGFTQSNSLKKHMRNHTADRPHCHVCHKSIQSKNLPQHLKLFHLICPDCKKPFSDKEELESHLRTHKEEEEGKEIKPFS